VVDVAAAGSDVNDPRSFARDDERVVFLVAAAVDDAMARDAGRRAQFGISPPAP
jgi:hypothetical protein